MSLSVTHCLTVILGKCTFTEETYRIPVKDIKGIPPIPTQPIGFEDAYALIWYVQGHVNC